jgi:hypothetical protein
MLASTCDLLRIPEKCQNYRYAEISQLLEAGQFCRYVGDSTGFNTAFKPVINSRKHHLSLKN